MAQIFSCYPSGTILLRTKGICWKRMRRLIISISCICLSGIKTIYFIHNYTRTSGAFPCGRTQHVRRMRSSIVSMIKSVFEFRFMRAIPHYYISGNISSPFQCKERFCDNVSFGIIPSSVQKCLLSFKEENEWISSPACLFSLYNERQQEGHKCIDPKHFRVSGI